MKTVCLAPAAKGVAANPSLKLTVSCSSKVGIQLSHGTPEPKVSGAILFRLVCVCERVPSFNCFIFLGVSFAACSQACPHSLRTGGCEGSFEEGSQGLCFLPVATFHDSQCSLLTNPQDAQAAWASLSSQVWENQ